VDHCQFTVGLLRRRMEACGGLKLAYSARRGLICSISAALVCEPATASTVCRTLKITAPLDETWSAPGKPSAPYARSTKSLDWL